MKETMKIQKAQLLILFALLFLFLGCGTCSLQLRLSNVSNAGQSVEIYSRGVLARSILVGPKTDTSYFLDSFHGTSLRFPDVWPDSVYVAEDVDHWFGAVHKDTVTIRSKSIEFNSSWYLYRRELKR